MVSIKICGLTDERAVDALIAAKADYAGFVYFPASSRHIALSRARELASRLPVSIKSVSVLVDPDDALMAQVQSILQPDYVQLHGHETPQRLSDIRKMFPGIKIIKAIAVRSRDDVASAAAFSDSADLLLFDAKAPDGTLPGGNGLAFDWSLLRDKMFPLPWMLSGGLSAQNVAHAIHQTGAQMLDVSSGVESTPGVKDPELIRKFMSAIRD